MTFRLNCIQLVRELPIVGGDVRKVGYYTGIIVRHPVPSGGRTKQYIIGVPTSCGGGVGRVSLEPTFRLCRPKACSFILPRGYNRLYHLFRPLPFFLGTRC
jgi:hypothetical protein